MTSKTATCSIKQAVLMKYLKSAFGKIAVAKGILEAFNDVFQSTMENTGKTIRRNTKSRRTGWHFCCMFKRSQV
jgi:hypothetical protein